MKIQFKNVAESFKCTAPVEQKIFNGGDAIGWLVSLRFYKNTSSTEIDNIINADNISELTFITETEDVENQTEFKLLGYSKIRSCVLKHGESVAAIELQLTKEATTGQEEYKNA